MSGKSNSERKVALITGITGQDASYLSEFLLARGYEVHGTSRAPPAAAPAPAGAGAGVDPRVSIHQADLADPAAFNDIIKEVRPSEVYNLAAQKDVRASFERCEYTAQVNALGVLRLLEAVRLAGLQHETRVFQASTCSMFGAGAADGARAPQNESTPFRPKSPYACAKLYGYWIVRNYRESYGMFASNGILFTHEGPRSRSVSVARKIARAAAALSLGRARPLELGNLDSRRDWAHAADCVEAMWLMLQQDAPCDLVIASGESHSVREFAARALQCAGLRAQWSGAGADECATDETGRVLVRVNPDLYRNADMTHSLGDPSEAARRLRWAPRVGFDELVRSLVDAEREWLRRRPDQLHAE